MARRTALALCLLLVGGAASRGATPSHQALRTCVDRWNQANMVGWGPALVDIAVRRLVPSEVHNVGDYGRGARCVASIAAKLHEPTWVCVIDARGAYDCARYSDGGPPLRRANGSLDAHGTLRLNVPPAGTHATPPLPWHRYPHVDRLVHPWTSNGTLRRGLTFTGARGPRFRGHCLRGSEYTRDPAADKCVSDIQFDSCFPPTRNWNRRGTTMACTGPGSTRFDRFVITGRS
jgi:hypothetical protein